ncbi:hypothetical protein T08_10763 [Trichinella sp. T8]|nr:hypothetical protein T08_10763 [Trichinella sp. T8]
MDTSLYNNNLEIKVSYQTKKNSSLAIYSCINLAQMNEHLIPFCLVVCICFELMFGKKLPLNQRNDSHPLYKQCHAQCSIETGLNLKLEHLFNVIEP